MNINNNTLNKSKELAEKLRFSYEKQDLNFINHNKPADDHRKFNLEETLLVAKKLTPKIYDTIEKVKNTLYIPDGIIEVFIKSSHEMNAHAFSIHSEHCGIVINSELIENLESDELKFVIGHEIGHFLLDHVRTLQNDKGDNIETLKQKRAQEISCDRIGLWACGDINIALSTIVKQISGLKKEQLGKNALSFFNQIKEIGKNSSFDRSNETHPPWFIRGLSLFHFSTTDFFIRKDLKSYKQKQVEDVDKRIENLLSSHIDNFANYRINKIKENYQFWYTTNFFLEDKKLSKSEQDLIRKRFGDDKLKRLKNILKEYSREEAKDFILAKLSKTEKDLNSSIPNEFSQIKREIEDFCNSNIH
tara:strand:+ start:3213 stop:4295 length:1083 start_codon:yes stop_codon:yes gene_type:complete